MYGGLFFIENLLNKNELKDLITNYLGQRSVFARYSYFDICKSLLYNNITQGEFLTDLETLKSRLPKALSQFVPSPDTVEYASQELKVENLIIPITKDTNHEINENPKFNKLSYCFFLPTLVKVGMQPRSLNILFCSSSVNLLNAIICFLTLASSKLTPSLSA